KRGGAFSFSTQDGWISFSSLSGDAFIKKGTFAAWVNVHQFAEEGSDVFSIEQAAADNGDDYDVITVWFAPNAVVLSSQVLGGPETKVEAPAVPLDTWALVVVEWDIDAKKVILSLRRDGQPFIKPLVSSLAPDFILTRPIITGLCEGGTLDEVRFWDRLL